MQFDSHKSFLGSSLSSGIGYRKEILILMDTIIKKVLCFLASCGKNVKHFNYVMILVTKRKKMKIAFLAGLFVLSTFLPATSFAIDFIWKDARGGYHYDCGGYKVGGEARVKAEGNGLYSVKGVRISGMIRAYSINDAAQRVCGEKPILKDIKPTQPE